MPELHHITFTVDGNVGRLTLNRPDTLNSMTFEMWREMRDLGDRLVDDPGDVRVLVVSGAGRAFSSGLDISVFAAGPGGITDLARDDPERRDLPPAVQGILGAQDAFTWLAEAPFATIAAIRGYALGGGLQLALACDLRIVARGAKLGLLEFRWGIIPDLGGTQRLPRLVGAGKAKELIFTAAQVDADEAFRIGLAEHVVAEQELDATVDGLAATIAAQPPLAVRAAKRAGRSRRFGHHRARGIARGGRGAAGLPRVRGRPRGRGRVPRGPAAAVPGPLKRRPLGLAGVEPTPSARVPRPLPRAAPTDDRGRGEPGSLPSAG